MKLSLYSALSALMVLLFVSCNGADSTVTDPCQRAQSTRSKLVREYGEPDFRCVTNPIKGVIAEQWRCAKETQVIYYSFGYEYGCGDSGSELYACGSTELPGSVKAEIESAGESNPCRLLLQSSQNSLFNILTSANLHNVIPTDHVIVR